MFDSILKIYLKIVQRFFPSFKTSDTIFESYDVSNRTESNYFDAEKRKSRVVRNSRERESLARRKRSESLYWDGAFVIPLIPLVPYRLCEYR